MEKRVRPCIDGCMNQKMRIIRKYMCLGRHCYNHHIEPLTSPSSQHYWPKPRFGDYRSLHPKIQKGHPDTFALHLLRRHFNTHIHFIVATGNFRILFDSCITSLIRAVVMLRWDFSAAMIMRTIVLLRTHNSNLSSLPKCNCFFFLITQFRWRRTYTYTPIDPVVVGRTQTRTPHLSPSGDLYFHIL